MARRAANGDSHQRRVQVFMTWCGPAFVVLFFGGWGIMAGMVPPPDPSTSAEGVARLYRDSADLVRAGLIIGMAATFLPVPFSLALSAQLRRAEGDFPILAVLQFASGVITTVVLIIPMLLFIGISFRPERSPELTRLVHELSWVMIVLPWPPLLGQMIPIAVGILSDRRREPIFPRWIAYFNLWCAVMLLPVTLLVFWQSGPFSWNGILGFWLGAAAFGAWYPIMTAWLLRAIRAEARECA